MMSEPTNASGTLSRTRRQSDTIYPHYFNTFQNYCNITKPRTSTSTSSNRDYLPIPEHFQKRANEILDVFNRILLERTSQITQFTSVLPREFFEQDRTIDYQKYLIDRGMFKTMTEAKVINWVPSLKNLYPVRTSGNGNCLLHAVLIAMIGIHDFDLRLRDQLRQYMTTNTNILKRNWKIERLKTDKIYGIQSEESKFDSEWEELCDLVRYDNTEDGQTASNLQFLEAVHIYALSNMLARPIIILSEEVVRNKHGEAISFNDLFGIYLPTLIKRQSCITYPIVLVYDQSHFCPLQSNDLDMKSTSDNFLPLYQSNEHVYKQTLLPIRFLGNDESRKNGNDLLKQYLRIKNLAYFPDTNSSSINIQCAELGIKHQQDSNNFFLVYYEYLKNFFEPQKTLQQQDYHLNNQPSYGTNQRILLKTNHSSSSSPPPPPSYQLVASRSNDSKKSTTIERRPSYGEAVNNGISYGPSSNSYHSTNQNSQLQKPQIIHSNLYHQDQLSNWESSADETINNSKITNSSNSRTNDSKLKQEIYQTTSVRVPVRFDHIDSSTNLIDFEQKTDQICQCIVCKRMFNDLSSIKICSECDRRNKPSVPPRQSLNKQTAPTTISSSTDLVDFEQQTDHLRQCLACKRLFNDIHSRKLCNNCIKPTNSSPINHVTIRRNPSNNYSNIYASSDFLTPKIQSPLKLICHYCKMVDLHNNIEKRTTYYCPQCGQKLYIS